MVLQQVQSYREFLKGSLTQRTQANPGYSLTAFAQKIGVSTSFLSEVLNSKKKLSMEAAFKIAVKLDLTDQETQYFCMLVQLEQEKDPLFQEEILRRLKALSPERTRFDLSLDLFRAIADWYHFALLELTHLPDFQATPTYVSSRLGITKLEAETALDRLKRLELIVPDATGRYKKAQSHVFTESKVPNTALKLFHKQLLEKARVAVDEQTPEKRVSTTHLIPIDSRYLGEAARLAEEFSSAVIRLTEKSKVKDSVYSLAVHLFKLTDQTPSAPKEVSS
jgi:uncharacterized protein (TIGR02147 family)